MLNYLSSFETVHFAIIVGIVIIIIGFGIARRAKQSQELQSADKRLVNEQAIEASYTRQLRISNKEIDEEGNTYEDKIHRKHSKEK